MRPHLVNESNTFIAGWYTDSTLCNEIVQKGELNVDKFITWTPWYQHYDLKEFDEGLYSRYTEVLHNSIELYKEIYPTCYQQLQPWGWTPPRIQRYNPGQFFNTAHCENDGTADTLYRHMAYMTYLNDIEIGGGTEFINQKITTSAEAGLTLIWPAQWTHYHRGIVAPNEVKYIITGWLCFQRESAMGIFRTK